ncbi:MAG: hypothetical protein E7052_04640 [Lentisphaerae bacterium]|nr:hypothetical protein [Lentisphaerota bacterium]
MYAVLLEEPAGKTLQAVVFESGADAGCPQTLTAAELPGFIAQKAEKYIVFDLKKLLKNYPELVIDDIDRWFDVNIACHLLDHTLGDAALPECWAKFFPDAAPEEDAAGMLWQLYKVLSEKLAGNDLFQNIEMPLISILNDMEKTGIALDDKALRQFGGELTNSIRQLETEIFQQCSCQFNLNSPKQLSEVLFEKLALEPVGKKGKNARSTDAEALKKISTQHPVIDRILHYRKLSKLNSTYVEGLLKYLDSDGRIHTVFNQTNTATGRLSSSEPNLQNLPGSNEYGGVIRKFFHAQDGYVFLDADYSQIELRILAHMADDPVMIAAFQRNEDIHTVTASQIFDVAPEAVTPEMRRQAKAVNFGIVYGMSAFALGNDLQIPQKAAQEYIDNYFAKYSAVKNYLEKTIKTAKQQGYVETLFGRRRQLPELKSKIFAVRSFGERAALNTPIQGTAAELMKLAMIKVDRALKQIRIAGGLLLQVHDELLLTVPETEQDTAAGLLRSAMENAMTLKVPLKVSLSSGKNYFDVK